VTPALIHVPATVHGRVLIESDEHAADRSGVLVGFHGYAQTAGDMMAELARIPGASAWTRIAVQALHPFYIRGDQQVVASWMTRDDRELAIADNVAYVDAVLDRVLGPSEHESTGAPGHPSTRAQAHSRTSAQPHERTRALVFVGFSQGVAMAWRAALLGARPAAGVIALAGDVPPELTGGAGLTQPWPRVLIGVGDAEQWYSPDKLARDVDALSSRGVDHSVVRFQGGHEWTDAFRASVGHFLSKFVPSST